MSEPPAPPPPPGAWHPDPADPRLLRYWDGVKWTEHTAPNPAVTPPAQASTSPQTAALGAGGMLIRDAVLLALFVPAVGFVMGVRELARGRGSQGALFLLCGVVSLIGWVIALGALGV